MNFLGWEMDAQRHALGRRAFILRYGVLRFGLSLTFIMLVTEYVRLFGATTDGLRSAEFLLYAVIHLILLGLGSGYAFGALLWRFGQADNQRRSR